MSQGLGDVAFARAAGSGDEDRDLFLDESTGGQVLDEFLIDGAVAGGFEAPGAVAFGKPDDALCRAEVVRHAIGEEGLDEGVARRPMVCAFLRHHWGRASGKRAPRAADVRLRWSVFPGVFLRGVNRHHFLVFVDPYGGPAGPQPELLAHQGMRHRVSTLLELNVAVPVNFHLGPGRVLRGMSGVTCLRISRSVFAKLCQHSFVRRAVDAIADRPQDPGLQLPIGISYAAEMAQGHKTALDILHGSLLAPLLLRVSHGAR